MNSCGDVMANASSSVSAALRAVDCVSAEATATAFTRLFGMHGSLLPALTLLLTIYIASFAMLLLTGRSTLSVNSLLPRMILLGVVITFTTSWVAYQSVVWNLTTGAPDQIAGVLLGARGSATQLFADRIDILFNAIAETASAALGPNGTGGQGTFTPTNLMWLSALMLLLATVGVLVTARIGLAILLALGPVFIAMALFSGTRGLFVGWLRGVIMLAITPLFTVLGGGLLVELAAPVVASLREAETIDQRGAMVLFVVASVYCALMLLSIRTASTMVTGWRVFGLAAGEKRSWTDRAAPDRSQAAPAAVAPVLIPRIPVSVYQPISGASTSTGGASTAVSQSTRNIIIPATARSGTIRPPAPRRTRAIGSRFARRVS
jgi:type IV secretion system protein VirB6